jgi:NAD(P)-dependent dehydrogenase (short-subunit alcohol dehydrogenase family)
MTLQAKNILVFAATGAIGGETAKKFAQEGAHVWISGRNEEKLNALRQDILAMGGKATAHVVDATDEHAVDTYVTSVAQQAQHIHATFNAIGGRPVDLGYPEDATKMSLAQFMIPLHSILGSTFLTSRAVGKKMMEQGFGSIITLSATLSVMTAPYMAGITATCAAIEGLTRSLAGEFGPANVRVNCVRGNGMPETRTIQETGAGYINMGKMPSMVPPPLGRPISVAETAAVATFLASDASSGMTAQVVTVSAGAFIGV